MKRLAVLIPIVGLAVAALAGASLASAQGTPSVNPVSATTAINTPVTINVLSTDSDSLGQFLPSTLLVSQPTNGSAVADTVTGTVTYTPVADFAGLDSFDYTVCDNEVSPFCGSGVVTVTVGTAATPTPTIAVIPPDILPTAVNDTATTSEGTSVSIDVLANDSGDALGTLVPSSVSIVTQPDAGGSATANADGTVTYTPAAAFTGEDSFEYQVCDSQTGGTHCAQAQVVVSVGGSSPAAATTTPAPATATPEPTQVAATPTEPPATVPPETPVATQVATQPPATSTPSPVTTAAPTVTETAAATPIAPSTGSGVGGGSDSTMPLALAAIALLCAGAAVLGYTASPKR